MVQSQSTGCSYTDYWKLYSFVRKNKPKEILECGTGVSTVVMAYALIENEQDGNGKGRVTSMESSSQYYDMQMSLIPQHIRPYVELILSDVIEDSFSLFRGVRYEKVPLDRKYDFVYVDGPSYEAPSDNTITFDMDYFFVIKNSSTPVYAIVDKRVSTCYMLQKVFGLNKVYYNSFQHIGYAGPCTKYDIKHFDRVTPSSSFEDSFKIFGNSELKLILNDSLLKSHNSKEQD